jgi:hypothetical protein
VQLGRSRGKGEHDPNSQLPPGQSASKPQLGGSGENGEQVPKLQLPLEQSVSKVQLFASSCEGVRVAYAVGGDFPAHPVRTTRIVITISRRFRMSA